MPELWIRCPMCEGKPLIPVDGVARNRENAKSVIRMNQECHNPLCEKGFIRYGQEQGHQHQWTARVEEMTSGDFSLDVEGMSLTDEIHTLRGDLSPQFVRCACGKTAAEVMA